MDIRGLFRFLHGSPSQGRDNRKDNGECRREAGETKLYEEKEGRFVTYSGIKVPQKMKQKTAEVWLRANMAGDKAL